MPIAVHYLLKRWKHQKDYRVNVMYCYIKLLHTNYITNMQKLYITCNCTVTTQTADAQNVNKFVPWFVVLSPSHKSAFENFKSRIFDLVYDDMFWIILMDGPNFPSQKFHNRQSGVVVILIRRMQMIK